CAAAADGPAKGAIADSPITISTDDDTQVTHITIQARKGRVAWSDLLIGLARAKGYDDAAFADLLPRTTFRLDEPWFGLAVVSSNLALPKGIRLKLERQVGREPRLTLSLDRAALL